MPSIFLPVPLCVYLCVWNVMEFEVDGDWPFVVMEAEMVNNDIISRP